MVQDIGLSGQYPALSFLETKHPPEPFPIRVIIGTAGLDTDLEHDMVAPAQAG